MALPPGGIARAELLAGDRGRGNFSKDTSLTAKNSKGVIDTTSTAYANANDMVTGVTVRAQSGEKMLVAPLRRIRGRQSVDANNVLDLREGRAGVVDVPPAGKRAKVEPGTGTAKNEKNKSKNVKGELDLTGGGGDKVNAVAMSATQVKKMSKAEQQG